MARIIGIDYGTKRTGLAATDPLQIIVSPLTTLHPQELLTYLKDYCAKEEVEAFVVGYPTRDDGSDTHSTPHIRGFIRHLEKEFPQKPVHLQDESFSSRDAMQAMIASGTKKKNRRKKENIDQISAVLILQEYLENNNL